jgi:hypothetical protein
MMPFKSPQPMGRQVVLNVTPMKVPPWQARHARHTMSQKKINVLAL